MIWFDWVYDISTIVAYLILNPLYTNILSFGLVRFYGISTIVGYFIPNSYKEDITWLFPLNREFKLSLGSFVQWHINCRKTTVV